MNIVSEDSIWQESKQCGECGTIYYQGASSDCDCGNPGDRFKTVCVKNVYYKLTFWQRFWSLADFGIRIKHKWKIRDTKP
ncbi:hypothetical protein LCGC14_1215850 [marine sediment metagenome]|uniref:Uncharacterized protein n=1 Tax=marine sediment metagenome TaxID=412755 RepID=A0A0F9LCX9_9ZZZZ